MQNSEDIETATYYSFIGAALMVATVTVGKGDMHDMIIAQEYINLLNDVQRLVKSANA